MFYGQFMLHIQDDGKLISIDSQEHILAEQILKLKSKKCSVCFDKENSEIIFSLGDSLNNNEDILILSSFVIGDTIEKIENQFIIPKEYLKYYADKKVLVIGVMNEILVTRNNEDHNITLF